MTAPTPTHRPVSVHRGAATCRRCGHPITEVFVADEIATGDRHTFGSDCHYQVTGVDTRRARQQSATVDRRFANRRRRPAAEVALFDRLHPTAARHCEDLTKWSTTEAWMLLTLRNWLSDPGDDLAEWLDRVLRDDRVDRELAAELADLAGIDLEVVTGKRMQARFGGTCGTCSARIRKGDDIVYNGEAHCAAHASKEAA